MNDKDKTEEIIIRGANVHNLKNIDVNVPLGKIVAIAGVSGSGKSSLALGTLYAEGSRRYLEALSTYMRRRITQAARANVTEIHHVPSALALHQRPVVPGVRSTFGTSCPNGHPCPPSMNVALMMPIKCPVCGEEFYGPGAEAMAFNSDGACPTCQGTGIVREIDDSTLVPDERLSIQDGAVLPWGLFGLVAMPQTVAELGVRIDVPFSELTEEERRIVFEGEETKRMIAYHSKNGKVFELNCVYINAHRAVEQALKNADSEKGLDKVRKFLHEATCPDCHGTRLSAQVRSTTLAGKNLAEATAMTLDELLPWVHDVPDTLPEAMRPMARNIIESFLDNAKRLKDLGLGYLSLDRASNTLSTGERQRVQLARAVRNETTGVLYVLDEPSIGLHPSNIDGLMEVVDSLIADGNSVVMVDHDVRVLRRADHMIEMGPMAGSKGGTIIAQGTVDEVSNTKGSVIAPFLTGEADVLCRQRTNREQMFDLGRIHLSTSPLHTVHALDVSFPKGRLITVTGVSGSGKTTMILECLIPAITALCAGRHLPSCVKSIEADGISRINLIDASPKPGAFSYNTGSLRCPTCDGTGQISLDVQFLPDVTISCPDCDGKRYSAEAAEVVWTPKGANHSYSLPDLLAMTVSDVRELFRDNKKIGGELQILEDLGLGYLTLGEGTPALSGGEAQRLKLASEMGRTQEDSVFVFDEPTIGLHPLDVQVLLGVFSHLVDNGATVIVIEHDLDVIANSDYLIDMGPGGGYQGGRIVAQGTPEELASNPSSLTGKYLKEKMIQG